MCSVLALSQLFHFYTPFLSLLWKHRVGIYLVVHAPNLMHIPQVKLCGSCLVLFTTAASCVGDSGLHFTHVTAFV